MQILDKGEVILKKYMAEDTDVVEAARVSNDLQDEITDIEKDSKLIRYLMKHRHGTPFEHTAFKFFIKAPLFVVREWQRHRIASYNEMSGRYVVFEPEFYIPTQMRIPGSTNKQGSVFPSGKWAQEWYEDIAAYSEEDALGNWNSVSKASIEAACETAYAWYLDLVEHKGVAKEMARMVLPLNLYTKFYFTVNARALMNFLSLRTADNAQWEIREYANAIEYMWAEIMPITHAAFIENGRIAP